MSHLSAGLKYLNSVSPNPETAFRNATACIRRTSDAHKTDIFAVISYLDGDGRYAGFRNWYFELARVWWKPLVPRYEGSRGSAEKMIVEFPIIITGARPGEIIIGTTTQSKNAVMKIFDAIVPPKTQVLDVIRGYDDLWERFITKLGSIEYFGKMARVEREMWLEDYQSDRDLYLEDVENLEVSVLSFGVSDFLNLPGETLELLGGPTARFDMSDVFEMFPKKPGSEGLKGRHTLVFRRGIWGVTVIYHEVGTFQGSTIDMIKGCMTNGILEVEKGNEYILTFDTEPPCQ